MLFRGQNILGYRPYADDVVEYFVQKSIANGIDIIRIFDCLNDIRNLQTAVTACNKEKGHAQVALSYTLGDAYTLDYWMDMAKRVEDMGADSLCIKDMAGLLVPAKATELVQALKDSTSLPVELHTHYTSGVASMTYMRLLRPELISLTQLCHHSLLEQASLQQRLWLRHSRVQSLIQVLILIS